MTTTAITVLGCTPLAETSAGVGWQRKECLALLTQLTSIVGTPPSLSHFQLHETHPIDFNLSYGATEIKPHVLPHSGLIVLAVTHEKNDSESLNYVLELEDALDKHRKWTHIALLELGHAYRPKR